MTREEAIAAGMNVHEIQHSMKRRTSWHDYSRKGTYMLTLVVRERMALLGTLKGCLEGEVTPYVEYSALGRAIVQEEQKKINRYYPQVEVWKLCVMPDHLHMIVRVKEDLPKGKHLGAVVRGFKVGCSRAWWRVEGWKVPEGKTSGTVTEGKTSGTGAGGNASGTGAGGNASGKVAASVTSVSPEGVSCKLPLLFEEGYNDKILLHEGQLDNWKHYLDDNPRRLMMKRRNPDLFTVLTDLEVAGERCKVVGNRFLLNIPDKVAVIVHRRYTDDEIGQLRGEWLDCGERGGVLVSAAISPKEKEIMREAMSRGYNIILLRENGFPRLYKPSGEAFDACAKGLLLQISPWDFHYEKRVITRTQCLYLNSMAERIVGVSQAGKALGTVEGKQAENAWDGGGKTSGKTLGTVEGKQAGKRWGQ